MELKEILKRENFTYSKRFGQNFITDANLLDSIVRAAGVGENDLVVEIGAGAGTLTKAIAKASGRVIAFEIDERLRPVLEETLSGFDNVSVIFGDFLKEGERVLKEEKDFLVVANIPYYITTPIIMECLEKYRISSMTLTVQKEVAERFTAKENTKEYGAITASARLFADASIERVISKRMFYPVPEVDSALLRFTTRDRYEKEDIKKAQAVIRQAFSMRRKTLINNLAGFCALSKEKAGEIIKACSIEPSARAETLSAEDFIRLAKAFYGD